MAKEKMLVAEKFDAIVEYLQSGVVDKDFMVEDMVAFLQDRKEKAARKGGSAKAKKVSDEVLADREAVKAYLEAKGEVSVAQVRKEVKMSKDSSQYAVACLKAVGASAVRKEKGVSFYALA